MKICLQMQTGFPCRAAFMGVWVIVWKKQYPRFPSPRLTLTQCCLDWELKGNAAAPP